jgi:hypothetical protein
LPLLPIAVLSLAPLAEKIASLNGSRGTRWFGPGINPLFLRAGFAVVSILALGGMIWSSHSTLQSKDYRDEVLKYSQIENELGRKKKVIALTEDYGYRLAYWGWINARIWPSYGDLAYMQKMRKSDGVNFRKTFSSLIAGMDLFLVTWFEELERQPELNAYLFQNYAILQQGDGFMVFDLKQPLSKTSARP